MATACSSKRFDGKDFTFFHLRLVLVLDERDGLSTMDLVLLDVMSADASHSLHRKSSTVNVDLVAFHCFLNGSTDIADANIYSGMLVNVSYALVKLPFFFSP